MYKSRSGLVQHKKSAAHQSWETTKELKDERCRRTLLENQNAALKKEISDLKEELRRVYRRIILENDSIES
jgi:chaperonin cofactor prefoldin